MNRKILMCLFTFILFTAVFTAKADASTINAHTDTVSEYVYIYGNADAKSTLMMLGQGFDYEDLSFDNFESAVLFTQQVNGVFMYKISLPVESTAADFKVVLHNASEHISCSPDESLPSTALNEDFDDAVLWSVSGMGVKDGRMFSKSADVSSAMLKGSSDAGFKNNEFNLNFSFDKVSGDGWLQFVFRDNGTNAERLIIRRSGITRYTGTAEKEPVACTLDMNTVYKLNIIAYNEVIFVTISDQNGIVARAQYKADFTHRGSIGFITSASIVNIYDLGINNIDTCEFSFVQKPIKLKAGTNSNLLLHNAGDESVTYSSSDENVAKCENGVITGVSAGVAYITAAADGKSDMCTVVVYQEADTITLSKEAVSLKVGESIGIRLTASPQNAATSRLTWTSSNPDTATVFGSAYTARTIHAEGEGTAIITAQTSDGSVYDEIIVRVYHDDAEGMHYASFKPEGSSIEINPYVFGVHHSFDDKSSYAYDMMDDIGFNMMRTFGIGTDNVYTGEDFSFANGLDIPHMVMLPFHNQTTEQIVEQVGEINASLDNNEVIYIEFGNELYDGSTGITVAQYIQKCREAYTAVKASYPNVKVGVPILAQITNSSWNTALLEADDCYDAIVLHNYLTPENEAGRTAEDTMTHLYGSITYQQMVVDHFSDLAPDKDVWISEWGTLQLYLFDNNDMSEKARMQYAKSTGVALCNMEHLMNMLSDENVDMSTYHFSNDGQGFGIIQDNVKLANYHVFKKISDILDECTHTYDMTDIYTGKLDALQTFYIDRVCVTDTVGAWGFGAADGQKYAVFSNRTSSPTSVDVSGKSLRRIWSYGGEEAILGDFLMSELSAWSPPKYVSQPTVYDESFADSVVLAPYQIVICEIEDSDAAVIAVNAVNNGIWDFDKNGGLVITTDGAISDAQITFTENGVPVGAVVNEINISSVYAEPAGGFKYGVDYELNVIYAGKTLNCRFTTPTEPFTSRYTVDFADDFADLSNIDNWTTTSQFWRTIGGKLSKTDSVWGSAYLKDKVYQSFVMTFNTDMEFDGESTSDSNCVRAELRDGQIRFYDNGQVYSYFGGKNDVFVGSMDCIFPQTNIGIKLVACDDYIDVYYKLQGSNYYSYIGRADGIAEGSAKVGVGGYGKFSIDTFRLSTNCSMMVSATNSGYTAGREVSLERIICGDNRISVTLSEALDESYVLVAALYGDDGLEAVDTAEPNGLKTHVFEFDIDDCKGKYIKLMLLDSLSSIKPLDKAYVLD